MDNFMLTPYIVAREMVRLLPCITGRYNVKPKAFSEGDSVSYDGILCNIRSYKNDDYFYFDIYFAEMNFTISLPMFNDTWKWSIDDFAERIIVPELYKKIDRYGYATWD